MWRDCYKHLARTLKAGGLFHITSGRGARGILADGAIRPNINYRFGETFLQPFGAGDVARGEVCLFDWAGRPDKVLCEPIHWAYQPAHYLTMHDPVSVIFRLRREPLVDRLIEDAWTSGIEVRVPGDVPLAGCCSEVLVYTPYAPLACRTFVPGDRDGILAAIDAVEASVAKASPMYALQLRMERAQAQCRTEAQAEAQMEAEVGFYLAGRSDHHPAIGRAWAYYMDVYKSFSRYRRTGAAGHREPRPVPLLWRPGRPETFPADALAHWARRQALRPEVAAVFDVDDALVVAMAVDDQAVEVEIQRDAPAHCWFLGTEGDLRIAGFDVAPETQWLDPHDDRRVRAGLLDAVRKGDRYLVLMAREYELWGLWKHGDYLMTSYARRWGFDDTRLCQLYLDFVGRHQRLMA